MKETIKSVNTTAPTTNLNLCQTLSVHKVYCVALLDI